jgi:hypothetical protein
VAGRVEAHVTDLEDIGRRCVAARHGRSPQDGAHARDELPQTVGLRHVVVGTDLEPDDGVDLRRLRRDHDDRDP